MTEYLTEQEQIEQIKNWIKQYGPTVIAGIVLALVIVTGWHYWEDRQNRILTHASGVYDEMLTLRAQNDAPAAIIQAQKLLDHYAKTPYAQMAAFLLARDAVANKDYETAITQLTWVIKHSHNDAMRAIAKIRIARIQLAEDKAEDSLNTLNKIDDKSFSALADETRGDAYLSLKQAKDAKLAYQQALQELPSDETTRRPLLQMKIDNLANVTS